MKNKFFKNLILIEEYLFKQAKKDVSNRQCRQHLLMLTAIREKTLSNIKKCNDNNPQHIIETGNYLSNIIINYLTITQTSNDVSRYWINKNKAIKK